MALQLSGTVRSARVDVIESTIGPNAVLRIKTGAVPASCGTADAGTVLGEIQLESSWMAAASNGVAVKAGTWEDTSANATGAAAHFRIYSSAGTTCHIQGTVTSTAGGGDLTLDNTDIAAGQTITITTFTLTDGNA